jgi:hypothetical protein
MGGNCSNATPGALTRFGPAKPNGLARSDHTGSTSKVASCRLDQDRGVADHCDPQAVDAPLRQDLTAGCRREPFRPLAAKSPAQELEETAIGGTVVRIEEPVTVEMIRRRPSIVAVHNPANRRRPSRPRRLSRSRRCR